MSDADLARTVRVLDDTRRIVNALNLYGLAIDTHRYELFDQVFAPDVRADYNPPIAWTDRESLKNGMELYHEPLDGSMHRITNHQVQVDGDRANSLSYVKVRLLRGDDFFESGGVYDDEFQRLPEGWRIKTRFYRGSWWLGNPGVLSEGDGIAFEPFIKTLRHTVRDGEVRYLKRLGVR
jgi:hypothetical protein